MPDSQSSPVDLEMKLAFLERTVEVLNEVILEQGAQLQNQRVRLEQLEAHTKGNASGGGEELRPHDDPPPHY